MVDRWVLGLEYDGAGFSGWQKQPPPVRTLQAELEAVLGRIADAEVRTFCAGRTDAGVHASYQVVHFDCPSMRPERAWTRGANGLLPAGPRVLWAKRIDGFHARWNAEARRYRYIIHNHPVAPAILRHGLAWRRSPLDAAAMHEAAQHLVGAHDFSTFRGADCQFRTPVRFVHSASVSRRGRYVIFDVVANAFLLHMVRIMVGSLCLVGEGRKSSAWMGEILYARDRRLGGDTAPPGGLYLVDVRYPAHLGLPRAEIGPPWLQWFV